MKMTERLERLAAERKRSEIHQAQINGYAPGEITALRREAAEEREAATRAKLEEARDELSDVDFVLASGYRLPPTRKERVAEAQRLRTSESGRARTHREIAAIMGVSRYTIGGYFSDPLMLASERYQARHPRVSSGTPMPRAPEPEPEPELDVIEPFGKMLKRRRKRETITLIALADALGKTTQEIKDMEASDVWPSPGTWLEMKAALERLANPPEETE